ncbi:MAG: carbamate kinase [Solirubrobacterales bacterium]
MRILIALGGNALLRRGEQADAVTQRRHLEAAAGGIASIAKRDEVVVTHGNGPQVGLLALQSESYPEVPPYPLDVLGAESEGMIGYMLEVALRNALPGRELITVLTEVVVNPEDAAFERPTKPVGPVYGMEEGARLGAERGWTMGPDGAGVRRLVPSPEPEALVQLAGLRLLLDAGVLLICAGGGGIPVTIDEDGGFRGVEAVVDKDLTAALLARRLGADLLLMLTDVDAVRLGFGTGGERPIGRTTPEELRSHEFEAGTIGPKVEAACRFVEATGKPAAIGALGEARLVAAGERGTFVRAA